MFRVVSFCSFLDKWHDLSEVKSIPGKHEAWVNVLVGRVTSYDTFEPPKILMTVWHGRNLINNPQTHLNCHWLANNIKKIFFIQVLLWAYRLMTSCFLPNRVWFTSHMLSITCNRPSMDKIWNPRLIKTRCRIRHHGNTLNTEHSTSLVSVSTPLSAVKLHVPQNDSR